MTAQHEQLLPSALQENKETFLPDEFIKNLYLQTSYWLIGDLGLRITHNVDDMVIKDWALKFNVARQGSGGLSLHIATGMILEDENFNYTILLGKESAEETLKFHCGYIPKDRGYKEKTDIFLRQLLDRDANNATASFSIDRFPTDDPRIIVRSWANSIENGAPIELKNPEKSQKGINESMLLIKDVLTRGHRSPNLK